MLSNNTRSNKRRPQSRMRNLFPRKTFKRHNASRYLINVPFRVTKEYGTNINNQNRNVKRSNQLRKARESIETSYQLYPSQALSEEEARLYAEFSAAYNDPKNMLDSIKKLGKKVKYQETNISNLNNAQAKLYSNLSGANYNLDNNEKLEFLEKILKKYYSDYY